MFENCLLLVCLLHQPEVYSWMETTTSNTNVPMEVIGADINPVDMLETLNLPW